MARALHRDKGKDLCPLESMNDVMPYASFLVSNRGVSWQLCCCGHEFAPGETMFWVPEAGEWVCLKCASRAFYGEDIRVEWVYIAPKTAGNTEWRKVPRWWAEERGLDWYGKNGPPPEVQVRVDEFKRACRESVPGAKAKLELDEERLERRHRMMSEPALASVKQQRLF